MKATPTPRLLLVEDDAVSAAFLTEALASLPAQIDHAASLAAASRLAADGTHQLWLVDANLPDGRGEDWLRMQRQQGQDCPALALTAEIDRARLDRISAAGFVEILPKPLTVALLLAAVRRRLGGEAAVITATSGGKQPLWDEAQALRALGGDKTAIATLRSLFLQELPQQYAAVAAALARHDPDAARAVLHQLKASTAFVGAARIAQAVQGLASAPDSAAALAQFQHAVSDYRDSAGAGAPDQPSAPMT